MLELPHAVAPQETESMTRNGGGLLQKGVIVISANCIIRMANERAVSLLGFGAGADLVGRNVNIIVPPPFAKASWTHTHAASRTMACLQ
jgi:sensor histidine kinase regulating citrate/malate metabolism